MATCVIEVTESNSEDICNLGGCLEAENGQKSNRNNKYSNLGAENRSQHCGTSVKASDYSAVGQQFDSRLQHYHFVKK